jgi:hypothetical protein
MLVAGIGMGVVTPGLADAPSGQQRHAETGIVSGWAVIPGSTLQSTLTTWASREGWVVVWDAPRDYRIRAAARLGPDFQSAVKALADAVNMTNPDLTITLYLGNRVIHVRDSTPISN